MPDISIIILTYNSANFIAKLLKSLIAKYNAQIDKGELEIIVADNSSLDDTIKEAKKIERVKVISNGGNFGFAKGINLASKLASGQFLLFINPDTTFLRGDVFKLLEKFKDKRIGVVGGEVLHINGKKEPSCGKFYNFFSTVFLALGLEEKLGIRFSPKKEKFVDFVSGGFMMVRKDLWEKLGGFDDSFFMYVEDMEFCFRVKKQKLKVLYSPEATIKHVGQASSNRSFAIVCIYKGILYFNKKHMGLLSYMLVKMILRFKAIVLVFIGKMSNNKYLVQTYEQALSVSS